MAAALFVTLALPAGAAAEDTGPAPAPGVPLTDGRTFAHWAHPDNLTPVRRLPSHSSERIAGLHRSTEDGFPEVYPVLQRSADGDGKVWLQILIPRRPEALTGWVPASALGPLNRVRTRLVVDRRRLRATLYDSGRRIWRSRVGVGKRGTPTPGGSFWIREKFRVTTSGIYGPRAFGTSSYSRLTDWPGGGVIGIHGTDQPWLLPGRVSHGCVRVPNRAITRLYRLMPIGTPVEIR